MEEVLYFVEEVFYFIVKWCSTFWVEHWHNKGVRSASAALWELDFRSRYSPGSIIIQLRMSLIYYSYYYYYYELFLGFYLCTFRQGQSFFIAVALRNTCYNCINCVKLTPLPSQGFDLQITILFFKLFQTILLLIYKCIEISNRGSMNFFQKNGLSFLSY